MPSIWSHQNLDAEQVSIRSIDPHAHDAETGEITFTIKDADEPGLEFRCGETDPELIESSILPTGKQLAERHIVECDDERRCFVRTRCIKLDDARSYAQREFRFQSITSGTSSLVHVEPNNLRIEEIEHPTVRARIAAHGARKARIHGTDGLRRELNNRIDTVPDAVFDDQH